MIRSKESRDDTSGAISRRGHEKKCSHSHFLPHSGQHSRGVGQKRYRRRDEENKMTKCLCSTKPRGLVDILRTCWPTAYVLLNHEDLLIYWGHHFFIWLNLLCLSFDWTCNTPEVPSRRLWSIYASLIHEPGATKLSILLNSCPKKALSFSPDVKCDQQTYR